MRTALAALLLLTACSTTTPPPPVNPTPWSNAPLTRSEVPAVYGREFDKAENRDTCALIAPRFVGEAGAKATPRAATFSGGWAVAYDLPDLRSAFGVAGSGGTADGPRYEWPNEMTWNDGSHVTYGPEGGTGPNELAYLQIRGQGCLYNIWSRLGRTHLESLIRELRFVR